MSVSRRQSSFVDVSQFDVEEQRREFERFMQEKADREMAARLHREEDRNFSVPVVGRNNARNDAVQPAPTLVPGTSGPMRSERRRRTVNRNRNTPIVPQARQTARPLNPPPRQQPAIYNTSSSSSSDSSVSSSSTESDSESSTQSSSGGTSSEEEVVITTIRVTQPLLGNDRLMYSREQELAAVDEGQSSSTAHNPPRRVGTPDGTWGDCTMCFEIPINPLGCNKCFQPIGCKTCVRSWYNSSQRPSCPLCRSKWTRAPDVAPMAIIDRRQTQRRNRARTATATASRVN